MKELDINSSSEEVKKEVELHGEIVLKNCKNEETNRNFVNLAKELGYRSCASMKDVIIFKPDHLKTITEMFKAYQSEIYFLNEEEASFVQKSADFVSISMGAEQENVCTNIGYLDGDGAYITSSPLMPKSEKWDETFKKIAEKLSNLVENIKSMRMNNIPYLSVESEIISDIRECSGTQKFRNSIVSGDTLVFHQQFSNRIAAILRGIATVSCGMRTNKKYFGNDPIRGRYEMSRVMGDFDFSTRIWDDRIQFNCESLD